MAVAHLRRSMPAVCEIADELKGRGMTFLLAGLIDYGVDVPISDSTFEEMQRCGGRLLSEETRCQLHQVAFSHTERIEMVRPKLADAQATLRYLISLTVADDANGFIAWLSRMAALPENKSPAEQYVYETLLTEIGVTFEPAWREKVRLGEIGLAQIGGRLRIMRNRLSAGYRGVRGGCRQHELGYALATLARVYRGIGGKTTASSHMNRAGEWIESTKFVRFAKACIERLPLLPGVQRVDVGRLIHRHIDPLKHQ